MSNQTESQLSNSEQIEAEPIKAEQEISEKEKQTWLLIIISILCIALLLFIYWVMSYPNKPLAAFKTLALDLIPGFIGALMAYIIFYFLFKRKGISLSGEEDMSEALVELRDIVSGVRDLEPTASIEIDRLYTLYGLKETRSSETFQNFRISRGGRNRNAVQFLWADTYHGNTINGEVIDSKDGDPWLRIVFNITVQKYPNVQNWGCNFAVKPQNDLAIDNNSVKRNYLIFDARVPDDKFSELKERNQTLISTVGLAVRVVNGYMQHWEYGSNKGKEYKQFSINLGDGWTSVCLDLSDITMWALFDSDGLIDRGPKYATFDEIASLVIKVGKPRAAGELDPGAGIVDVRDVRLSDNSPMAS